MYEMNERHLRVKEMQLVNFYTQSNIDSLKRLERHHRDAGAGPESWRETKVLLFREWQWRSRQQELCVVSCYTMAI